jgi:tetratricopeptide (TPR) repeat protein
LASGALLAVLAVLTWRQSANYADYQTLFFATAEKNPDSWMVQSNLGMALMLAKRYDEALIHLRRTLELKPNAGGHFNIAVVLTHKGKPREAMEEYRAALALDPDDAESHENLGALLARAGQGHEALIHLEKAVELKPGKAKSHASLGELLASHGFFDKALEQYQAAFDLATANRDKATANFARSRIERLQRDIERGSAR